MVEYTGNVDTEQPTVDTTKAPTGERGARSLVGAVLASDDRIEHHYLELKSTLDLTKKRDQAKVAKFILGAANRLPDVASRAFGGYAVMVIGASGDHRSGIPPVEMHELERALLPFLGHDGPAWDLVRVPIADSPNEILLILVDPPKAGQGPFVCQKDGGDGNELRDGAIYFRASGQTREARSGEVARLIKRGRREDTAPVSLSVTARGAVTVVDRAELDAICEEYITARRNQLMVALVLSKQSPAGLAWDGGVFNGERAAAALARLTSPSRPEERTEEEYRREISDWANSVRDAWPSVIDRMIAGAAASLDIDIQNAEATFLEDVELAIHVGDGVRALPCIDLHSSEQPLSFVLPDVPRRWGPHSLSYLSVDEVTAFSADPFTDLPGRTTWVQGARFLTLTSTVGDLRPRANAIASRTEVVLFADGHASDVVTATWEATVRQRHEVFNGEFTLPVVAGGQVARQMRELLELTPSEGSLER